MHRLAICSFVLLFAHSAYAGDARLDKPVTLSVKGEALADIMPIIEKQTGVRLRVAHDIADQKATVFVDDKPLKEVMAGLQTVFQYTWSYTDFKGERSYTLSMPGRLRREQEGWRKKAVDKAWQEFETEVKRLADIPVKSVEELDKMLKEAESTERNGFVQSEVGEYGTERRKRAAARLYRTFSPELKKALRDGMTICYDLDSPEPEWKIPPGIEDEWRQNLVLFRGFGIAAVGQKWESRREYGTLSVEMTAPASPEKFSVEAYERLGPCASYTGGNIFALYEKLLVQLAPPPKKSLPREDDDPILDGKVSYTSKELDEEAALPKPLETWRQGIYINRSDLLALLHKKLGLQIISDHYSHWYAWGAAEKRPVRSILESLERFPGAPQGEIASARKHPEDPYNIRLAERYPSADWGWDGKLLCMRAANPAKMDSMEIPNRMLRRWQEASKAGSLGLTEAAEIHTLTEEQLGQLKDNVQRLGIEWARHAFGAVDPALRLYGLLSPSQRQFMLDGGLSTQGFNAEQRSALLDLVSSTINDRLDGHKGCRVGIYDAAGRRVDKADPGSSAYPESVRLEWKRQMECFTVGERQVARTLEETLKQVKTEKERAMLRKLAVTEYEMTLTYADGTESKKKFKPAWSKSSMLAFLRAWTR